MPPPGQFLPCAHALRVRDVRLSEPPVESVLRVVGVGAGTCLADAVHRLADGESLCEEVGDDSRRASVDAHVAVDEHLVVVIGQYLVEPRHHFLEPCARHALAGVVDGGVHIRDFGGGTTGNFRIGPLDSGVEDVCDAGGLEFAQAAADEAGVVAEVCAEEDAVGHEVRINVTEGELR